MLDVITVVSQTTKKGFVNQSKNSVAAAASQSAAINKIITSGGVVGNIGRAFKDSLRASTADYVCWVDDDDLVLPNAFSCVEKHLASHPAAVCAKEIYLYANGRLTFSDISKRHHLTIYRRDVVDAMPLEDFPKFTTQSKIRYIERNFPDQIIDEPSWVYIYRKYNSAGFYLRHNHNIPDDAI
jgi:hypothetical protein